MCIESELFMAKEIERKFLVDPGFVKRLEGGIHISQGYVKTSDKTVVRARVKGSRAFLTLKGEVNNMTCSEFEYEIPVQDAKAIIEGLFVDLCDFRVKYRQYKKMTSGD
jgi:adenylate cyclase